MLWIFVSVVAVDIDLSVPPLTEKFGEAVPAKNGSVPELKGVTILGNQHARCGPDTFGCYVVGVPANSNLKIGDQILKLGKPPNTAAASWTNMVVGDWKGSTLRPMGLPDEKFMTESLHRFVAFNKALIYFHSSFKSTPIPVRAEKKESTAVYEITLAVALLQQFVEKGQFLTLQKLAMLKSSDKGAGHSTFLDFAEHRKLPLLAEVLKIPQIKSPAAFTVMWSALVDAGIDESYAGFDSVIAMVLRTQFPRVDDADGAKMKAVAHAVVPPRASNKYHLQDVNHPTDLTIGDGRKTQMWRKAYHSVFGSTTTFLEFAESAGLTATARVLSFEDDWAGYLADYNAPMEVHEAGILVTGEI